MIIKCTCGKFLGVKKLFQKGTSHGLCQDCLEGQLFKIKGYLFKWILYKGYRTTTGFSGYNVYNRIVACFLGIVAVYLIGLAISLIQ